MFGGRERPPYKPGRTATLPVTPARGTPLPGGIYASPTNKGTAYTTPKTLPQGEHLQAGRERQANGQGKHLPRSVHGGAKIFAPRARPCGLVALRNAPAGAAPPYRLAGTGK